MDFGHVRLDMLMGVQMEILNGHYILNSRLQGSSVGRLARREEYRQTDTQTQVELCVLT